MDIRSADFESDLAAIRRVRFAVFVDEQQVPEDIELDERDPLCIHVLAFDGDEPIGTGRIDFGQLGKIGRIAVLASRRREGVGTALMKHLHELAIQHDLEEVWCHAQVSSVDFYERLGYGITSDPFYEADIEHVRMECAV